MTSHRPRVRALVMVGLVAFSAVAISHTAGCSGGASRGAVLPDAAYDAFDLAAERDAGPSCLFDKTPHKLGSVYTTLFHTFAVGKTLYWFGVEDPLRDDGGSVGSWSAKPEGGSEFFNPGSKGPIALWVDRNAVYSSPGRTIGFSGTNVRHSDVDAPRGFSVRAMTADDKNLYALLSSSGCDRVQCDSPLGHQLAATPLVGDANWVALDSSMDRLPPSPWRGDIAQDVNTVFFIVRSQDGRAEIRAVDKNGGPARALFGSGMADAGSTPCKPPEICIDGDLRAYRGNVYWLGGGGLFVAPAVGGSPSVLVDPTPSRVTAFAIDDDVLYTNELAPSGHIDLVRRSLSKAPEVKVIFSHQLVEPASPYKVGAIAIGPNAIYTLVETAPPRFSRDLVGLCKD